MPMPKTSTNGPTPTTKLQRQRHNVVLGTVVRLGNSIGIAGDPHATACRAGTNAEAIETTRWRACVAGPTLLHATHRSGGCAACFSPTTRVLPLAASTSMTKLHTRTEPSAPPLKRTTTDGCPRGTSPEAKCTAVAPQPLPAPSKLKPRGLQLGQPQPHHEKQ